MGREGEFGEAFGKREDLGKAKKGGGKSAEGTVECEHLEMVFPIPLALG